MGLDIKVAAKHALVSLILAVTGHGLMDTISHDHFKFNSWTWWWRTTLLAIGYFLGLLILYVFDKRG